LRIVFKIKLKKQIQSWGTHAWPEINKSVLTIVEDELVDSVLDIVKKIDSVNDEVGIRAFVWDVLKMV
jgi:hypothetical protein